MFTLCHQCSGQAGVYLEFPPMYAAANT